MVENNSLIDSVSMFYKQNDAYYHTIHHIKKLFDLLEENISSFNDEFKNYESKDYDIDLIKYAIAYHDAFYVPGFKGNEYISAQIAEFSLRRLLSPQSIVEIVRMIESTDINNQTVKYSVPNIKIIHDLDWSRFIDYNDIEKDDTKIFNEAFDTYHQDEQYRRVIIENQYNFYKKFSQKKIFYTNTFEKFNAIVENNMKKRMEYYKENFK